MSPSLVQAGDLIAGKYRVERVLGAGGMGVVVAATHVDLEQQVAIKLLLARTPEHAERLLREARAAVRLRSEHAGKVLDVGRLDDGTPFLVLEYLEGRDLDQVLLAEGPLDPRRAAGYLVQACEAVAEAHALGIVHRDLKPQNLFLSQGLAGEDVIKVLDFGIAKTAGFREEQSLTGEQSLMGSPVYMPPEQMRSSRAVTPQGDIWALGVTLQELLTGRTPFEGDSLADLCLNVVGTAPRSPLLDRPDLPVEIVAIIARCLARDPRYRFAHAGELATALESMAPPESSFSASRARLLTGMHRVVVEEGATVSGRAPFQSSSTLEPAVFTDPSLQAAGSLRPFATSPTLRSEPSPLSATAFPALFEGSSVSKARLLFFGVVSAAAFAIASGFIARGTFGSSPSATARLEGPTFSATALAITDATSVWVPAVAPPAPEPAPPSAASVASVAKTEPPPPPPPPSAVVRPVRPGPRRAPTPAGDDIPSMR